MTYRDIWACGLTEKDAETVHERHCPAVLRELGYKIPKINCEFQDCEAIVDTMLPRCAACWDQEAPLEVVLR